MSSYHNPTAEEIAAGLKARGYAVSGPDGGGRYRTSTAICHGGDNANDLVILPGENGFGAYCWTAHCEENYAVLMRDIEAAAGFDKGRSSPRLKEAKAKAKKPKRAALPTDPPARVIATYTSAREDRPDKEVFRQDWPGTDCDGRNGCNDEGPHKHMWQDRGSTSGYRLLPWGPDAEGHTLLIVEGEKAARAMEEAGVNGMGYTPVSWLGGSSNVKKADYSLVSGRRVYLWPDNDKQGKEAMEAAGRLSLEAEAVEVKVIPVYDLPHGGDAADLEVSERIRRLADATSYEPLPLPVKEESKAKKEKPRLDFDVPEVADAQSLHLVNFSPLSDAMRLLSHCPRELLLAEDRASGEFEVYQLNKVGIWESNKNKLGIRMVEATIQWHKDNIESLQVTLLKTSIDWIKRLRSDRAQADAYAQIPGAYHAMREDGLLPDGLRYCETSELNAKLQYLGTKSGVLDLLDGNLLPPEEGAEKFITRSIPDPFDLNADKNPDAQKLLQYLPEAERTYLLEAASYALKGVPNRRWYVLSGEPGTGKTTFLSALGACLGPVKDGGYHCQLSQDALMQSRFSSKNAHTEDLIDFPHARIASKSELPRNAFIDVSLIKDLSGGGEKTFRAIHQKAKTSRRATATIFVSVNEADARRIDVTDSGFAYRTKILPYEPVEGGFKQDDDYITRMQDSQAARMGVMAMLVKAGLGKTKPPIDIDPVKEAMEEQKRQSLDEMGVWLRDNLKLTGNAKDVIPTYEVWEAAADAFATNVEAREIAGYNKKELNYLARRVLPGFPASKVSRVEGKMQRVYAGLRWREEVEEVERKPVEVEEVERQQCVACGGMRTSLDSRGRCQSLLCQAK